MPVFNHADLVIEMIESIRNNTFTDWELLAVDDGSNEDEYEKVQSFVVADSRINYFKRKEDPKGAQTCRNIGFQMAQGEFVCFFDSDDTIKPYCLEQRVKELTLHPELDFIIFRSDIHGNEKLEDKDFSCIYGYGIYDDDIAAFCARTLPFVVWNNIYRKSSIERYGITWDIHLLSLQDAQFNLQTLLSGMKYAYSTRPADYMYRIDTVGSISKKIFSDKHHISNLYAAESFYKQIQNRYGNKYNKELYDGSMFINLKVSREQFSPSFSKDLADIIGKYSTWYGFVFRMQILLTMILINVLPYKLARQIPMMPYLIKTRRMERKWIPQMIKRKLLLLILAVFSLGSCAQSIDSRNDLYELSWSDDFNGNSINDSIWSKMNRVNGARCFCNLTSDNRMYDERLGRLRLYARYNNAILPNDTARFLTGGVTSEGKKTFAYGKIEVRARIHGAIGTWPAIWTMPENRKLWENSNPEYTEIDILEYVDRNDSVYQTAHNAYTLADKKNWEKPKQQCLSKIKREKYNIYSVEILPNMLIFGINGEETFRYPKTEDNKYAFFYGIESHIMMDMQVYPPKFWSSGLKPKTFPAYMDIDWIKVYDLK